MFSFEVPHLKHILRNTFMLNDIKIKIEFKLNVNHYPK